MPEKAKVPAIRFKGFTDAWEQRKVSEIANLYYGGGTPSTLKDEYWHGVIPWIQSSDIAEDDVLNVSPRKFISLQAVNHSAAKIVPDDSIAVITRVGVGKLAFMPFSYTTSQDFLSLSKLNVDGHFAVYSLYRKLQNDLNMVQGTSIKGITKEELLAKEIAVPEIREQIQIGSYFRKLDNLITLHQRKFEKLHNVKKAMLEKMFPENGNNVPEIRFAGFTDAWEQRKFSDNIISIQTGTNLLGGLGNTGIPLLKMGNIQRGYFSLDKIEYLDAKDEVEKENIAYYGDFFFNTRNTLELVGKGATWTGESGKYAFNSNIARFVFKDIDTIFFNYLYNTQNMIKQVNARAMGTTSVAAIYPRNLNSVEYKLPSLEEQNKIGLYFQNLDNLITLHQRKLEKLKNIKKACLEKMFV